MTTEYRRMMLGGPDQGRWEEISAEVAERLLAAPIYGIGSIGDQRADPGQYWEKREDGEPWTTHSYFVGAADMRARSRELAVERLENDERILRRDAQGLRDGAGATIEGYKNQIAAAEAGLKQALEDEKRDKASARELERKADDVRTRIAALKREVDRGTGTNVPVIPPPEPATA